MPKPTTPKKHPKASILIVSINRFYVVVDRVAYSDKLMSSDCREDTTKSRTLDDTFGWVFFSIDELLESAAVRASKVLYGHSGQGENRR